MAQDSARICESVHASSRAHAEQHSRLLGSHKRSRSLNSGLLRRTFGVPYKRSIRARREVPLESQPTPKLLPIAMTRVLILGGDSDFNLGDAAILTALCRCLAATDPRAE